jgi:hypothetical protein
MKFKVLEKNIDLENLEGYHARHEVHMTACQLEFIFEDLTDEEKKLHQMQKQIDESVESMGKVRRRLFAQMSELKKEMFELKQVNESLKQTLCLQSQS